MKLLTLRLTKLLSKQPSLRGEVLLIDIMLRWVNLLSVENILDFLKQSVEDVQTKLYVYRALPTLQELEAFSEPRIRQELISLILEFIIAQGFNFYENNNTQNLSQVENDTLGLVDTVKDEELFLAQDLAALSIEQEENAYPKVQLLGQGL